MDKSFHYFCIRVLAEKAGLSPDHAQTIAYASQYTDDSTEFGKMNIHNIPGDLDYPRWDSVRNTFDPVCTAHSAKSRYAKVWKWAKFYLKTDVQRKILMPFHFLLPQEMSQAGGGRFQFVTRKDSPLANAVVENALAGVDEATDGTREEALVKLGVALHTYADTWSHDGFSGRHSSKENDIKNVKVRQGTRYKSANPLEFVISYAAPDVGHAEAGTFPDASGMDWKAKYANKAGGLARDNTAEFFEAAEKIYGKLRSVSTGTPAPWDRLSPKIRLCLKQNDGWEDRFAGIEFRYSRFTWRSAALSGDTINWDDFDDERDFEKLNFTFTGNDMKWLWFHKAAFEQRRFLEDKIPPGWLSG